MGPEDQAGFFIRRWKFEVRDSYGIGSYKQIRKKIEYTSVAGHYHVRYQDLLVFTFNLVVPLLHESLEMRIWMMKNIYNKMKVYNSEFYMEPENNPLEERKREDDSII